MEKVENSRANTRVAPKELLDKLYQTARIVVLFRDNGEADWSREKVDFALWGALFPGSKWEPDEGVANACARDETVYDWDDVLNAIFDFARLVYDSSCYMTIKDVRRWVQRSLYRSPFKMESGDGMESRAEVDGDALASVDAGVDDMPEA